ncbi:MAG: alkaline phosphatase PhoX, partial [Alphaproteobacteria bacterium]
RPNGSFYRFATNTLDQSEFAGVTFSPDGTTMFVNYQWSGKTFAITGPFPGMRG